MGLGLRENGAGNREPEGCREPHYAADNSRVRTGGACGRCRGSLLLFRGWQVRT